MKKYILQTTTTISTYETVTALSEEDAIANGGTTGENKSKQVTVQKTAVEFEPVKVDEPA